MERERGWKHVQSKTTDLLLLVDPFRSCIGGWRMGDPFREAISHCDKDASPVGYLDDTCLVDAEAEGIASHP